MTEFDVLEELMDTEPFLRLYPRFSSYVSELEGVEVGLGLALEFYAAHVLPEEVVQVIGTYGA